MFIYLFILIILCNLLLCCDRFPCESFWEFTCRIAKMFFFLSLFLIYFLVVLSRIYSMSCDLRRGSGCTLQSPQLILKKKLKKYERKALTLDAIFFKDELFFLNVAFIALWLYVYIVVVYRNNNKKNIFQRTNGIRWTHQYGFELKLEKNYISHLRKPLISMSIPPHT